MRPKAIILDLDGTLLNSSKTISQKSIEVLKGLKASGIKLIFATARPTRCTEFKEIDLASLGTMVFYNGALFHCIDTNEQIDFSIPSKKTKELIEFCFSLDQEANLSIEVGKVL
ncbi:MAG: HAD hydrolase family protein [Bacillaceae bacterium]|nr:HAD hydrolase family protein [Bacillaceae bacterium]